MKYSLLYILPFCLFWALSANAQSIPNFHQVSDGIYRGGNPIDQGQEASSFAELQKLGVKIDIDLQGGDVDASLFGWIDSQTEQGEKNALIQEEESSAMKEGIHFVNLPLNAHAPIDQQEAARIEIALSLLANAKQAPVFLHCEHGADRTGLVIALYRVLYEHWSIESAHEEWVKLGHSPIVQLVTGELDQYFYSRVGSFTQY